MIVHGPISSMLFVPGDDRSKADKLWSIDAPAFALDLEDAVAISRKAVAREIIAEQLERAAAGDRGRELYVRINAVDTSFALADLLAVVRPGLAGLLIPKVGSDLDVRYTDWVVGQLEAERSLEPGSIGLIALIESGRGISNADEIARSSSRLICLALGAEDLKADLGIGAGDGEPSAELTALLSAVRSRLVVASAAAGINPPQEGVFTEFRDLHGLRHTTESSRRIGFFGRYAIHPGQVPVIETVFSPGEADIEWAHRVVTAFAETEATGCASVVIDGEFVDYAIAARAQRVLDSAQHSVGSDHQSM